MLRCPVVTGDNYSPYDSRSALVFWDTAFCEVTCAQVAYETTLDCTNFPILNESFRYGRDSDGVFGM